MGEFELSPAKINDRPNLGKTNSQMNQKPNNKIQAHKLHYTDNTKYTNIRCDVNGVRHDMVSHEFLNIPHRTYRDCMEIFVPSAKPLVCYQYT